MTELRNMEEGLLDESDVPFVIAKKIWWPVVIPIPFALLFLFLWLAESQYSHGVLRTRNYGEECGVRLFKNLKCSRGLLCVSDICQFVEKQCPSNTTHVIKDTNPDCPECPNVHPWIVTYFNFDEGPNRWLSPGPHGFYQNIRHLPYGACKELCASQEKCKAISYEGPSESCHLMQEYHFPAPVNNTWNYAIKVI